MKRARLADLSPADRLRRRVDHWAARLRVMPRIVRVQRMTRKWGSYSRRGILTLALDLERRDRSFQDFVIVHELLHIRIANHGRLFKALMSLHVPKWRAFEHADGRTIRQTDRRG
jgi:predicted metal-dependent hydrolase